MAVPVPPQQFDAARFHPDGGVPIGGALLSILLSFAAAVAVGMLVSFIHQWFYLVVLFPIGMGLAVGLAGCFSVSFGNVRSGFFAGLVGLLAGILVMMTAHYGDYLRFLGQVQQQFPGVQDQISFAKFIDLQATEGVSIGRIGRGADRGINLGYVGSFIYWGVEILFAAGLAMFMMKSPTGDPFCTSCQRWKTPLHLGSKDVAPDHAEKALNRGEIQHLLEGDLPPGESMTFTAYRCNGCPERGTIEIKVQHTTENAKGEKTVREVGTWSYPAESLPTWLQLFGIALVEPPGVDLQ